VDYEHIPFRCHKCHEHGHLYRDCPTINREYNQKATVERDHEGFTKVRSKGKGGKHPHNKASDDKHTRQNSFKIPEEEEGHKETVQDMENATKE